MSTPYHRLAHVRPWHAVAELFFALVLGFISIVVAIAVVMMAAGAKDLTELDQPSTFAMLMLATAALIPITRWLAARMRRDPGQLSSVTLRLRRPWLVWCAAIALLVQVIAISPALIALAAGAVEDATWPGWSTFLTMLPLILLLTPLQAAGEEYLFRGTMLQAIGAWTRSPWPAIAITSIGFAAIHGASLHAGVSLLAMGFIGAWLTVRTGGLEAAIADHTAGNVVGLVALVASGEGTTSPNINQHDSWAVTIYQVSFHLLFAALVLRGFRKRSAQGLSAVTDQVEQHAPERSLGVEHADHRADAEPLPPQQQ